MTEYNWNALQSEEWRTRWDRAQRIFDNWISDGLIPIEDMLRVMRGEYHYIVTFRSKAPSKGVPSKNGYVVITNASSSTEANEIAKAKYGDLVSQVIVEYEFDPRYRYKYGEITRHKAQAEKKEIVTT